jgi:hypothetical protein
MHHSHHTTPRRYGRDKTKFHTPALFLLHPSATSSRWHRHQIPLPDAEEELDLREEMADYSSVDSQQEDESMTDATRKVARDTEDETEERTQKRQNSVTRESAPPLPTTPQSPLPTTPIVTPPLSP